MLTFRLSRVFVWAGVCVLKTAAAPEITLAYVKIFFFFRRKSFENSQLCDADKRPRAHIHNMMNEQMNIFPHFHTHILHISIIYEVSSFSILNSAEFIQKKPYVHRFAVDKWDLASKRKERVENQTKMVWYKKNSVKAMCQLLTKPDFHKFQISSAHTHNTFNCVMLNVWSTHIFFVGSLSFFSAPLVWDFLTCFSSLPPFWWCEDKVRRAAAAAHILIRVWSQHELYENYLNSFFLFRLPPTKRLSPSRLFMSS